MEGTALVGFVEVAAVKLGETLVKSALEAITGQERRS